MSGLCDGRVVVVTGAARGIGRGHALEFAAQGARVVVNDLGVAVDGSAPASRPAEEVVEEITAAGGEAVADGDDASDWDGARRIVDHAVHAFGRLDVVVNNAGILRDRMLVNMTWDEWDAVMRVHLGGTFCMTRWAATYWRERVKAGERVDARVVNTTSGAGFYGNPGQVNYSAAKAGIAAFTVTAAAELARYGVTVNAVAPGARTRMTGSVFADVLPGALDGFDPMDPHNVAPLVVWLGSAESSDVTGRVFEAWGGRVAVPDPWRPGPRAEQPRRWDPAELGPVVRRLLAEAPAPVSMLEAAE